MTTASYDAAPRITRRHAWALALVATMTMAVSYIDRQALAALAPTICKVFDISETNYGFLLAAFSFAYLLFAPVAGVIIDHVGARRGLLGAVLVWSFVAALHALVPGFGVLLFLRIALATAEAPSFPGAAQTIQRALPPNDRARGFGVLFTGSSIGAMVAPPLATFLFKRWGWQVAFLGTALAGLIWVPFWLAFAWRGPARDLLDARTIQDKPKPSVLSVVRHPAVLRGGLGIVAVAPAMGFVLNWASKFLVAHHHMRQDDVGQYLMIPPLLYDAGSILFGHLASVRRRHRPDGSPDRALFSVAVLLTLVVAATPLGRSPNESMVIAGIGLAGGGGLFAMISADYLARVHPSIVSTASGMAAAAQSIAYIVFAPVLGKLIEKTGGYAAPFLTLGLWMIPGSVVWLLWKPPPPYRPDAPSDTNPAASSS